MPQALTRARIAQFVADGYVRIDNAFSTAVAAAARGIPWRETGWHIDVSFGLESPDFLDWRANVVSRGRALLTLFLFSDVGPDDAPTRIRAGAHRDIARRLAPAGDAGLSLP